LKWQLRLLPCENQFWEERIHFVCRQPRIYFILKQQSTFQRLSTLVSGGQRKNFIVRKVKLKIAIIGAGAMGLLFGSLLSKHNEVALIDIDAAKVDTINKEGIRIKEADGMILSAFPKATISSEGLGPVDLTILFVKSMHSRTALEANRRLIGQNGYVLSLQNGSGHDAVLREFVPEEKIIIGSTQHNSSIIEPGTVHHGGGGNTFIGLLSGETAPIKAIEESFNKCGLETEISNNIQQKVWEKLFLNASASVLTAIFQTNLGFLIENEHAWVLTRQLIKEAVAVANGDGMGFEEEKILTRVHKLLENARAGYTSIFADIRAGRKTEVDAISGAIVAASRRNHTPAPSHEFVVELIHALEDRTEKPK
jgi:2-dehydropantoate 2-reductase